MAENKNKRVEKNESSKLAYHELQMSDMKFDAHSAFIAPTHRKRLRAMHIFLSMPERKETFNGICNRTQVAERCLV